MYIGTIYKHEICDLMRFLILPGLKNNDFDEFLMFYSGFLENNPTNLKHPKIDPMFKITQKNISDAQHLFFDIYPFSFYQTNFTYFHF